MSCSIVYAFSPIANVTQLPNGNYLISITDKFGTTTAEVNNISQETINYFIEEYFKHSNIIEEYIAAHNIDEEAHEDIRALIHQVTKSDINGNIKVDGQELNVYTLPSSVVKEDDILILDCGHANTNY